MRPRGRPLDGPHGDEPAGPGRYAGGMDEPQTYRLLTGRDDATFSEEVSRALDEGYVLHGGPAVTWDGEGVVVAQAVILAGGFDGRALPA